MKRLPNEPVPPVTRIVLPFSGGVGHAGSFVDVRPGAVRSGWLRNPIAGGQARAWTGRPRNRTSPMSQLRVTVSGVRNRTHIVYVSSWLRQAVAGGSATLVEINCRWSDRGRTRPNRQPAVRHRCDARRSACIESRTACLRLDRLAGNACVAPVPVLAVGVAAADRCRRRRDRFLRRHRHQTSGHAP